MKINTSSISALFAKITWLTSLLLMAAGPALQAEKFVIAVIPDSQGETGATPPTKFTSQMQWIVNNKTAQNIKFVAHVGDVVNWDTPYSSPPHYMYVNADSGFDLLDAAGIPYGIALGNHDTAAVGGTNPDGTPCYCGGGAAPGDVHANLRNTTTYNTYFPTTRFTACQDRYEVGKSDNAYHTFSAGGFNWLVINTELDPRQGALDWMKTVVASHPHHNIIYVTHNYLTSSGGIAGGCGYGDLPPQQVWDQLLKAYSNVRMVFCGHVDTASRRDDLGVNGNHVYQMLSDYQGESSGNGWLRLVEIDTTANTISVKTYSPYLNQYKTDDQNQFSFTGISFVSPGISVPNFSFEAPVTSTYIYNPSGGSWTFGGNAGVSANNSGFTSKNPPAPQGAQVAFVQRTGTISQGLGGFVPGTTYKVTFAAAQRGTQPGGGLGQTWNVTIDGTTIASYAPPLAATNYVDYTATFTATATSHTLAFIGTDLNGGDNTIFIDNVRVGWSLPSPWQTADIGAVGATGNASYNSGTFTLVGSGADIWNTADEFRFVYQSSSGDCSMVAKVVSVQNTDPWAKAGVMIRETTASGSIHAGVFVTPGSGISFQRRTSTGGSSLSTTQAGLTAPYWVKLTRTGNSFAAYYSSNGTSWTQLGTAQTITMATAASMGLVVTSHRDGTLCTATLSNVTATP